MYPGGHCRPGGTQTRKTTPCTVGFAPRRRALRSGLTCDPPEFRRFLRVPPTAADHDTFGHDLAVADQVLADDVLVIELALLDRDQGGVAGASRLEAA